MPLKRFQEAELHVRARTVPLKQTDISSDPGSAIYEHVAL